MKSQKKQPLLARLIVIATLARKKHFTIFMKVEHNSLFGVCDVEKPLWQRKLLQPVRGTGQNPYNFKI